MAYIIPLSAALRVPSTSSASTLPILPIWTSVQDPLLVSHRLLSIIHPLPHLHLLHTLVGTLDHSSHPRRYHSTKL